MDELFSRNSNFSKHLSLQVSRKIWMKVSLDGLRLACNSMSACTVHKIPFYAGQQPNSPTAIGFSRNQCMKQLPFIPSLSGFNSHG